LHEFLIKLNNLNKFGGKDAAINIQRSSLHSKQLHKERNHEQENINGNLHFEKLDCFCKLDVDDVYDDRSLIVVIVVLLIDSHQFVS